MSQDKQNADKMVQRHKKYYASNIPMQHRLLEKILEDIESEGYGELSDLRKIATSPFKLVKDMRNSDEHRLNPDSFITWRIMHLGVFAPRKEKIQVYIKNRTEGDVRAKRKESGDTDSGSVVSA